jgi:hypothetical protein
VRVGDIQCCHVGQQGGESHDRDDFDHCSSLKDSCWVAGNRTS